MGQHKYNPTYKLLEEGKLPPKKKSNISKRQMDRMIMKEIEYMTGLDKIYDAFPNMRFGGYYNW